MSCDTVSAVCTIQIISNQANETQIYLKKKMKSAVHKYYELKEKYAAILTIIVKWKSSYNYKNQLNVSTGTRRDNFMNTLNKLKRLALPMEIVHTNAATANRRNNTCGP